MTASTLTSDNGASSGTSGIKYNGGTDGTLQIQTTTSGGTATTAVTIDNSQNTTLAGYLNAPNTFGFKNRIINGAMMIDQRNNGAQITVNSTTGYIFDRWTTGMTQNGKFTSQQNAGAVTPPVGFKNYLGLTSTSAYSVLSSDIFSLIQPIEGLNVSDLAWGTANAQTITLSFRIYSSLTGTFGGALTNNGVSRSYPFTYTVSQANTWTTVVLTIAGDTSGTWLTTNGVGINVIFGLGGGSTYSGAAGSWASAGYYTATGAVSIVGTNGATFYITGVQLEKGSTSTSFDYRPYGTEFQLCQRYYETGFFSYENGVSGNSQATYSFQALKRTTSPTVAFTNVSAPATGTQSVFQVGQSQFAMKNASATGAIYWNATWTATAEL